MKKNNKFAATFLRKKAEDLLKKKSSKTGFQFSESETLKLIHELEVHHIELELQNEELLMAISAAQNAIELYDFAPSGYFTLSKEGKIIKLNLCGSQMLGKERSRLINSLFVFFVSNDTKPIFNLFLWKVFNGKAKETCDVTLSNNGNSPMYVHLAGIVTENGKQCLVTVLDITERKKAEIVIIESQRLGAIVEMASSVAHDFNNSLQSILGNLELAMLKTDLSETTLQYLETIKTVVIDAASRIQLLQRFNGKIQTESKYFNINLNALISEVIIQSRPLCKDETEKKGLSIDIITEFSEIPKIYGNYGELKSAFYNIIKNSIEAMPKGGKIIIKTGKNSEDVYVTITDTGIGMDEKIKTRIFQPFFTTKGFDIGRGLGMSGVYSIIKEHGGNIYVINTESGKGTTIEILLPISKEKEIKEIKEIVPKNNNIVSVLWVEDNAIIRKSASVMIEMLGYKGDTAKSGKEALKLLENNIYDIVITDIGMSGMSGWELADIIKEKFGGKIKVVVVTGWNSDVDDDIKKEHGVEYVLEKPFTIEQLKKLFGKFAQLNPK